MSSLDRREIPIALLAIFAILQLVDYYYDDPTISTIAKTSANWGVLIASVAVGVGAVTLVLNNLKNIQTKKEGWIYNAWTIILLVITILVGIIPPVGANPYVTWLYDAFYLPISATLYATLAFFISSAAFRSFKARNKEAAVMLVCAFLIMLRNAPITRALFPIFGVIGDWLYDVPTKAGQRTIIIGTALGIIMLGIRSFLGREKALIGETT